MSEYEWPPSEDELRELYHGEKRNLAEVAEAYGATDAGVNNYMQEYGIERRAASDYERNRADMPGGERLREMYHDEGMTLAEMAEELDVSANTVSRRMEEHGIDRRTGRAQAPILPNARGLRRLYRDMGYTFARIADIYGVTDVAVSDRLDDYGIERLPRSERAPSGSCVREAGDELANHIRRTRRDAAIDGGEPAVKPTGDSLGRYIRRTRRDAAIEGGEPAINAVEEGEGERSEDDQPAAERDSRGATVIEEGDVVSKDESTDHTGWSPGSEPARTLWEMDPDEVP